MQSLQSFAIILLFVVLAFDVCESDDCSNPLKSISVSQSGKADFKTIQSAIDSVSAGNSQWIRIQISSGVYKYIPLYASTIYFSNGKSSQLRDGVITAQYRDSPNDPSGFVFKNCNISGTGYKTQLGRPMGAYARVIIANSYLSDVVRPEGWSQRTYVGHESNLTFVEEGCTGPGADKSRRVKWMKSLSRPELDKFLSNSFIDQEGWISKLPTSIFH
ncbi:hypothetical protein RYX36_023919 [Vicia faba]